MLTSIVSVIEHQVLTAQASSGLNQTELDWLIRQNLACFSLTGQQGQVALKVRHYLGVIQLPTGRLLEILPKVSIPPPANQFTTTEQQIACTRAWLTNMLTQLIYQHPNMGKPIEAQAYQQALPWQTQPLAPVVCELVQQFLDHLQQVVGEGLNTDYQLHTQNTSYLQGKLLLKEQLQHNAQQPLRFYHQTNIRQHNTAINRLLNSALCVIKPLAWVATQPVTAHLARVFAQLPHSVDVSQDSLLAQHECATLPVCYKQAVQLAVFLLGNPIAVPSVGKQLSQSLLFNMQHCFERWVSLCLQRQFAHHQVISKPTQVLLSADMVEANTGNKTKHANSKRTACVTMQPDMVLKQQTNISHIIDVKWKNISKATDVQAADVYQMLAYAQGFFTKTADQSAKQLWLIYPKTAQFTQVIKLSYQLAQGEQSLWLVPFCMEKAQVLV